MIKLPLFQGSRRWPHILRTSHFCISVSRNIFMKRKNNYYDDIMCTSRRCSSPKMRTICQWNWRLCLQAQDSLSSTDKVYQRKPYAGPSHRLRLMNTPDDKNDDYQPPSYHNHNRNNQNQPPQFCNSDPPDTRHRNPDFCTLFVGYPRRSCKSDWYWSKGRLQKPQPWKSPLRGPQLTGFF